MGGKGSLVNLQPTQLEDFCGHSNVSHSHGSPNECRQSILRNVRSGCNALGVEVLGQQAVKVSAQLNQEGQIAALGQSRDCGWGVITVPHLLYVHMMA